MRLSVACALLIGAGVAGQTHAARAIECSRARTPVDTTICSSQKLLAMDAKMSELFGNLRRSAAGGVLQDLALQQRDWLRHRDAACGRTPQAACLSPLYGERIDELTALTNKAATNEDDELRDLHVVILRGEWKPQPLSLTGAEKAATLSHGFNNVVSTLNPPAGDRKVIATVGQLCLEGGDCEDISWSWSRLGQMEGGPRLESDLHLPASQRILVGQPTTKYSDETLLVPGNEGAVSALASICPERQGGCRNVLQAWTPAGTVKLPAD